MSKVFQFGEEARKKILNGINILNKAVCVSLGPKGRTVIFEKFGQPQSSKDGVTIARQIFLKDEFENMGAQMAKEAASKTNEQAGDGTTSATLLTQTMVSEGLKLVSAGYSPIDIKRGMDFAVEKIIDRLSETSKKVTSKTEIAQIGTISSNGDKEIGDMLADAMEKVGNDGVISLEESKGFKTELSVVNGYQFDRGYLSEHFSTNSKLECELKEPLILLTDVPIGNTQVIIPILQKCHEKYNGRPLLIIAEDTHNEALATLVVNKLKAIFSSCAVKAPGFGDRRKEMLSDIAILTGATVISDDIGLKLENFETDWLGFAKSAIITKNSTTIVEGSGDISEIEQRVKEIRSVIENSTSDWDKEKQEERLAKLSGGVAVISVGAPTEAEMKEKKDRVEDALNATKSATEEGIVAGGGVALLRAGKILDEIEIPEDFIQGAKIIKKVSEEPLKQIVLNAGGDPTFVRLEVLKNDDAGFGFNARTEKFENLIDTGVIDPTKVVKSALQNASSVAGLILTTECMIVEDPDKKDNNQGGMPMM